MIPLCTTILCFDYGQCKREPYKQKGVQQINNPPFSSLALLIMPATYVQGPSMLSESGCPMNSKVFRST